MTSFADEVVGEFQSDIHGDSSVFVQHDCTKARRRQ